jgi:hypothetical protein
VRTIIKVDDGAVLDLHLHFLSLAEHACGGELPLSAQNASTDPGMTEFVAELRAVLGRAGVLLGDVTFDDVAGHPDLDAPERVSYDLLASLSPHTRGINLFWTRSLNPVGLDAALITAPGEASAVSNAGALLLNYESVCHRSWPQLARTAAHQIARYLGLSRTVEPADGGLTLVDPVPDTDQRDTNLLHFSDDGGTDVTRGQRDVVRKSAVLR